MSASSIYLIFVASMLHSVSAQNSDSSNTDALSGFFGLLLLGFIVYLCRRYCCCGGSQQNVVIVNQAAPPPPPPAYVQFV